MKSYALFHVSDGALRRDLFAALAQSRTATARVVAHIGEFDARRLYAAEGYPSMFQFCVREMRLSEDAAYKRIQAARAAREDPVVFEMLADGRLHLSAVLLLSKHLTRETAGELLTAAVHRSKREIEQLLAERFPQSDVPARVMPLAPAPAEGLESIPIPQPVATQGPQLAPGRVGTCGPRPRVAPLAPERYGIQFTMGASTHEAMRDLERLLGRKLNAEDLDAALRAGFEAMAAKFEKRRFAATDRPRKQRWPGKGRHIPAAVKRAVRARDRARCTFVAENGRRCEARSHLEFDHIDPVARGGRATVENLRLRCRAHNQYEADQAFGTGFMHEKRERARKATAKHRARVAAPTQHPEATAVAAQDQNHDVIPWLRQLGFKTAEARRAAAHCAGLPGETLEARVKSALSFLAPPARRMAAACAGGP